MLGLCVTLFVLHVYTVFPIRYRTRHFFNNSNTNEDIATKFEREYVRILPRKSSVWALSKKLETNILSSKIIKEMPGSVASGTPSITVSEVKNLIVEKFVTWLRIVDELYGLVLQKCYV